MSPAERIAYAIYRAGGPTAVATACGLATAKFYDWCNGTKQPNFEGLAQLATATGVDLNWLVLGKGKPFPGRGPARGRTHNTNNQRKGLSRNGQDDHSRIQ